MALADTRLAAVGKEPAAAFFNPQEAPMETRTRTLVAVAVAAGVGLIVVGCWPESVKTLERQNEALQVEVGTLKGQLERGEISEQEFEAKVTTLRAKIADLEEQIDAAKNQHIADLADKGAAGVESLRPFANANPALGMGAQAAALLLAGVGEFFRRRAKA